MHMTAHDSACMSQTHTLWAHHERNGMVAASQEARGGEVVVREGLLVQPPTITAQPPDATVNEGATVQLKVAAVVRTRHHTYSAGSIARCFSSLSLMRLFTARMPTGQATNCLEGLVPRHLNVSSSDLTVVSC